MSIQWYPGHMTKALRRMKEDLKLVDLVIELLDARIPYSSGNPDIRELTSGKSRIVILNKADLADPVAVDGWVRDYASQNIICIKLDSRKNTGMDVIRTACREACAERIERDLKRGIKNRPVRIMVAGIPNVGKSTFINSLAKKAGAKTGNKPGVTKGSQWIRVDRQMELLDTPGILWPRFDDESVGRALALCGSINDDILNIGELAVYLMDYLRDKYEDALISRYGECGFEAVARRLGCIGKGGEYDYERAYKGLIDDFRSGRLGRISLEVAKNE